MIQKPDSDGLEVQVPSAVHVPASRIIRRPAELTLRFFRTERPAYRVTLCYPSEFAGDGSLLKRDSDCWDLGASRGERARRSEFSLKNFRPLISSGKDACAFLSFPP